jgi:hypothetical protein
MLDHEDTADELTTVLQWLHARLIHRFTVIANNFEYTDTMLRGREPAPGFVDADAEPYVVDVFVRVAAIHVDRDRLSDVEILEEGDAIRLTFFEGNEVEILDEG